MICMHLAWGLCCLAVHKWTDTFHRFICNINRGFFKDYRFSSKWMGSPEL